jgi:hypothetical protein
VPHTVLTLNARSPTTNDPVTLAFVESLTIFADLQRIVCEPRTATQLLNRTRILHYKTSSAAFSLHLSALLCRDFSDGEGELISIAWTTVGKRTMIWLHFFSHEVRGSIPVGSTNQFSNLP